MNGMWRSNKLDQNGANHTKANWLKQRANPIKGIFWIKCIFICSEKYCTSKTDLSYFCRHYARTKIPEHYFRSIAPFEINIVTLKKYYTFLWEYVFFEEKVKPLINAILEKQIIISPVVNYGFISIDKVVINLIQPIFDNNSQLDNKNVVTWTIIKSAALMRCEKRWEQFSSRPEKQIFSLISDGIRQRTHSF